MHVNTYNQNMTMPKNVIDAIENAFDKEKASVLINALKHTLDTLQKKAKDQEVLIKAKIKDEILNGLVTRDVFQSEIKRLEEKIDQESEKLVIKIDQKGEEVKNSLIKWLIGFFVAQMAVFFSMIQIIK